MCPFIKDLTNQFMFYFFYLSISMITFCISLLILFFTNSVNYVGIKLIFFSSYIVYQINYIFSISFCKCVLILVFKHFDYFINTITIYTFLVVSYLFGWLYSFLAFGLKPLIIFTSLCKKLLIQNSVCIHKYYHFIALLLIVFSYIFIESNKTFIFLKKKIIKSKGNTCLKVNIVSSTFIGQFKLARFKLFKGRLS